MSTSTMASPVVLPPPPASSTTPVAPAPAAPRVPASFEFTRRKRWADLLINELSEGIILALNISGRILFCSHSSLELLGWRDDELVDHDISQIMHRAPILRKHSPIRIDCQHPQVRIMTPSVPTSQSVVAAAVNSMHLRASAANKTRYQVHLRFCQLFLPHPPLSSSS